MSHIFPKIPTVGPVLGCAFNHLSGLNSSASSPQRDLSRLHATTETRMAVPLGTGTSLTTFPEAVVIGLASGTTSSWTDFFKMLNVTG